MKIGQPWAGMATWNPFWMFGRMGGADGHWAGWVYAVDADTGVWKWRLKSNYPIVGGMTPTAGGVVFFGDWAATSMRSMPPTARSFGARNSAARSAAV